MPANNPLQQPQRTSQPPSGQGKDMVVSAFEGPIPPPATLAAYDKIVPGAAERIIAMAESQVRHRHEMENHLVTNEIANQKRGQIFGFILGLIGVAGGIILIGMGRDIGGLTAFLAALASLVGIYIYGQIQAKKPPR